MYDNGYGQPGWDDGHARGSRRRGGCLSHLGVAIVAAAVAAVLITALHQKAPGSGGASPAASPGGGAVPAPATSAPAAGSEQAIVNKVRPGLVTITTQLQYSSQAAAGTGMVISPGGLVLTNNHVIDDSTSITATVAGTGRTYPAAVVGYDKAGDIALLRLRGAAGLPVVPLGGTAAIKPGAPVLALGNAAGQGAIVPAAGQVTALNRTITASDQGAATSETLHGMIEASADVVPGDSGGPLVSSAGQVIGMDTAGNSVSDPGQGQQPAGFAIPISTALSAARQMAAGRAGGGVSIGYPPFLGIFIPSGTDGSPRDQAQQQAASGGFGDGFGGFGGFGGGQGNVPCYTSNANLAVPSAIAPVPSGTLVDGTICGSPAAKAGMAGGAVITAVNGTPAGAPSSLSAILSRFRPGDTIAVTWVSPSGHRATSRMRLVSGPPQ